MNGLELLEAIRRETLDVGAILVSCLTKQGGERTMKGLDLGAFDFITKPDGGTAQENMIAIRDALTPHFYGIPGGNIEQPLCPAGKGS